MVVAATESQNRLVDKFIKSILIVCIYINFNILIGLGRKKILDPSDTLHRFIMIIVIIIIIVF